ncbi:MAG: hypothetical protein MRJ96_16375 [Nitrospirales bacterium]|nr:hypothetical protein [Nitrospira sp.]MDR4503020.1 hypothetical protein [Nitrospirales bacterium]
MTSSLGPSSSHEESSLVEICLSYRYSQEHPWVVQGITGFLSAYYMEQPDFHVRRHYDELETGRHIWVCDVPDAMNIRHLLKRLQCDLPPSAVSQGTLLAKQPIRYLIDMPED